MKLNLLYFIYCYVYIQDWEVSQSWRFWEGVRLLRILRIEVEIFYLTLTPISLHISDVNCAAYAAACNSEAQCSNLFKKILLCIM